MSEKITFTIQSIRPPGEGQKSGRITTTDGDTLWLWANKLGLVKVGGTYEAEAKQNGTFTNIDRPKQTAGPVVPFPTPQPAPAGLPGRATPASGGSGHYRPTSPVDAERMFVTKLLGDAITSGHVPFKAQNLDAATNMLREVWKHTFGRDNVPYREAAE